MVRVLHLSGQFTDFQAQRGSAALAQAPWPDISISHRAIGPSGDDRYPLFTALRLRNQSAGAYDIVHAWDVAALKAAALANAKKILFTAPEAPGSASGARMRLVIRHRNLHIACASAVHRHTFIAQGIAADRCHVIRPGIDASKSKRVAVLSAVNEPVLSAIDGAGRSAVDGPNAALRAALGFADRDYVLLAPGESTRSAGHDRALWAASILHVLDPRYRILLWGRGPQTAAALQLAGKLCQPTLLTLAEQKLGRPIDFEELPSACDVAIIAPAALTATLPIAHCMAAGLPIISATTPALAEVLCEKTAMLIPTRSARTLAQCVLELRQNPAPRQLRADNAAARAAELFSPVRFADAYRDIYHELA